MGILEENSLNNGTGLDQEESQYIGPYGDGLGLEDY